MPLWLEQLSTTTVETSLCSATTYADNVALPAAGRLTPGCCVRASAAPGGRRDRSISAARRAHSSKPACSGFTDVAPVGPCWDRQTDGRIDGQRTVKQTLPRKRQRTVHAKVVICEESQYTLSVLSLKINLRKF